MTRSSGLETRRYSIGPTMRKYVKGNGFLSFSRNLSNKYGKRLLDIEINASKKVIHKVAQATGEFIGNKINDAIAKLHDNKIVKTKSVEEIIIPQKYLKN